VPQWGQVPDEMSRAIIRKTTPSTELDAWRDQNGPKFATGTLL
jgi:hypothetical protein